MTLYEDLHTFMTISLPVLLRISNVSDKYVEKSKHSRCGQYFFYFIYFLFIYLFIYFRKSSRLRDNVEK